MWAWRTVRANDAWKECVKLIKYPDAAYPATKPELQSVFKEARKAALDAVAKEL
jgi:hypothetical protein